MIQQSTNDLLRWKTVGAKQNGDNRRWEYVWRNIATIVSEVEITALVGQAVAEVKRVIKGNKVAYAWSGGKDSQALRVVMEKAGITQCVLGMTAELEYPEFLRWATDNMPWGLDVISTGQTLDWLAGHLDLLFPQDSKTAGEWFKNVQHRAQALFYRRYDLDMLILGRRLADRNYVGTNGLYTTLEGITRYSPIRHWSQEQVLGVCYYFQQGMAPCYRWPNGWVVGTGSWPARQWTGTTAKAWDEIFQIDPSIVAKAATKIASAREYLEAS